MDWNFLRQRMQQRTQNYLNSQRPDSTFNQPPTDINGQIDQMANSEKLTPFERGVYRVLPGVAKSPFGKLLESFSGSWAGKALNVLDIGAEGVERGFGLMIQLANGGIQPDELKAAWYAGSLTADTANITPRLKRDTSGKIIGVELPEDLPDVKGLVDARNKIQELLSQGVSAHDALIQVRDEYYNGLGALALRAQLQDTFLHSVFDPINYIMPALKPVERLKVKALVAVGKKVSLAPETLLAHASEYERLAQAGGKFEDLTLAADDALRLAERATDPAEAARLTKEANRLLGVAEEVSRNTDEAARLRDIAAKISSGEFNGITQGDRLAMFLTGADEFNPSKARRVISKIPLLNMTQLTPESKAKELMTLMSDNIGVNVVQRVYHNPDAVGDFTKAVERIASGAVGTEFGHALLTVEGRTAQAFAKGVGIKVRKQYEAFVSLAEERNLLTILSDTLGERPSSLIARAGDDPALLLRQLEGKLGLNPALDEMLRTGQLTTERLETISKLKNVPYNKDMFFAQAMDTIEEHAMRQALTQFGVQAKGTFTRWADAMKAAEGLAFLRLNPAYPVRNFLNNEMTMLARGVWGLWSEDDAAKLFGDAGWIPSRMQSAFTTEVAEVVEKSGGKLHITDLQDNSAIKLLEETLRGGNYGAPEKARNFLRKMSLGKLDSAAFSQRLEKAASRRAMMSAYTDFMRNHARYTPIARVLDSATMDALEQVAPGLSRQIDNAVRASGAMENKLDELLKSNLHLNVDSVLDEAGRNLGMDVREALGGEVLEHIHQNLPKAIQEGRVEQFIADTRLKIDGHIQDLFDKQLENVVEHVKAQTVAGGPQVMYKYMGQAQDLVWQAHTEHALRTPEAARLAREATTANEFERANILWERMAQDDARFFDRMFRRTDAYLEGMERAARETGIPMPRELRQSFREWKGMWQEFFDFRNSERRAFFEARLKGREYKVGWDDLQAQLDDRYGQAVAREDELMRRIDDSVAQQISDPAQRQAFINSRDVMAQLRTANKEKVIEITRAVRDLPADQRQAVWNTFWQEQADHYQQMRDAEAAGRAIMQGDPQTVQMFSTPAPTEPLQQAGSVQQAAAAAPDQLAEQARRMGVPEEEIATMQRRSTIYDIANEYGISSATGQGGRNDQRILNTVNKYLRESLVQPDSTLMEAAVSKPRHLLPPELSQRMEQEAKNMLQELETGQPGQRNFVFQPDKAEPDVTGIPTTNPEWYSQLYESKRMGKKSVAAALKRIIEDGGKDGDLTGVQRMKEIIMGRLTGGYSSTRGHGEAPPNLYIQKLLGADDAELKKSLEIYNDFAEQYGRPPATLTQAIEAGKGSASEPYYNDAGQLFGVNEYTDVSEIPDSVARAAFEASGSARQAAAPAAAAAPAPQQVSRQFIGDLSKIMPDPMPIDLGLDQMAYGRTYGALDSIVEGARTQAQKIPASLETLPADLRARVLRGIGQIKDDMSSTRYTAVRYSEWRRDSALLNYNRRTKFDAFAGNIFPFIFWTTGSVQQWAIHSIDRPAMLTTYLRMKKLLATSGLQQEGQPSRTKGNLRIQLPFAPEWMGDQFVDPLRVLLPFDAFAQPFEQMQQAQLGTEGRAQRLLQSQLEDGLISQDDFDAAIQNHQGPVWDKALAETQRNDDNEKYDAWDFATSLSSPHAPIMWAYNAMNGHPEDIGPFAPASRIMRNAFTLLGVDDYQNSSWNVEGKIRRQLGLPAFDKWDDYRVDRALSDLAGIGEYSVDDIKKALYVSSLVQKGELTPDEAKQQSPAYAEGVKRANQEYTGGPAAFALSLLGLNVKSVPQGETRLRALQDDFSRAYETYNRANKSLEQYVAAHPEMGEDAAAKRWEQLNPKLAKGADALTQFFDDHPEYETRLGLFDKPEERIGKFMVDQLWTQYNSFPDLNKREIRDQLGQDFEDLFLNRNTRDYSRLSPEQMAVWLKLMGGNPVGTLSATEKALLSLNGLKLTNPEAAWRVQTFYDIRKGNFGNYYQQQQEYFALDKAGRRKYLRDHPDLGQYWDWRRDWMTKNPDLAIYLTDNEDDLKKYAKMSRQEGAVPNRAELQQMLGPEVGELLQVYQGQALPPVLQRELEYIAYQNGMTYEQMLGVAGY